MRKIIIFNFILLFIINLKVGNAQTNKYHFSFSKDELKFSKKSGFDFISYRDYEISQAVGAPVLPFTVVQLNLPAGREIAGVTIVNTKSEFLKGEYYIYPGQPPQILSNKEKYERVSPDIAIYSSHDAYPKDIVKISNSGSLAGNNVGSIFLSPLQYFPSQKRIKFYSEIEVEIQYKESIRSPILPKQSEYSQQVKHRLLNKLIYDYNDQETIITPMQYGVSQLPDEEHLYVIITSGSFESHFQALVDWKLKKGLSAIIVTTSYIYTNYAGNDNQEKIRNFIIDAYQSWGTMWILLGGDTDIVPSRKAFAFDCEYGEYEYNYIPCDLYYSDLDGDWNANGNTVYGEVEDDIDMYADVFVGRAPVKSYSEADVFVNKILTYEKNGLNGNELNMLFLAEVLWYNPYTNSGEAKDYIDEMYVPDRFDPITKLYMHNGNENYESVIDALNEGQNIINHDGHAGVSVMLVGEGLLNLDSMDELNNGPNYSILFSIGCWPAAFDYDCIAEHFVTNPNGGGVAFVGNSRYGWGSPGNPLYGYSDRFDQQFFKSLFVDDIYHIGSTLSAAKSFYVPYAAQGNVYRWCEYQVNLLGDPEMPVWTDTPGTMIVNHPETLPFGESQCVITVTDANYPVEGALVCMMQGEDVYQTGITGFDGMVSFQLSTSNMADDLQITVSAHNYLPYENTISLYADEPCIQIASYTTNGSTQGFVVPGATISMNCCFKNYGTVLANSVSAVLSSGNTKIVMIDSTESIGTIPAGDSIVISNVFSFQTDPALVNGEVIHLDLEISASGGHSWSSLVGITVSTPVLSYSYYQISDSSNGDDDDFAEPGELIVFTLAVQNTGLASAQNASVTLSSNSSYLSLPGSAIDFGEILPGSKASVSFDMSIEAECPNPTFPQINMLMETSGGYQFADSFLVSVGEFGIQDNMELGNSIWTHTGSPDLWHLTSGRRHSGNFSWHCGNKETIVYDNFMDNSLESNSFIIDQNSELSFWCWYELPNYGVNGIHPEINDGSGWKELDFIGSGGALGVLTTGNDWFKYSYDLSHYPAGTSLKLRFRFVSDGESVTEGIYIDDVIVQNKKRGITFTASPEPFSPYPELSCEEVDENIILSWESNADEIENYEEDGYSFQGYNVYQLRSLVPVKSNAVHVTTFDIIDGVTEIVEDIIDPDTGLPTQIIQQYGSDSGIQRNFIINKDYLENYNLVKGKTYYFAVTAYTYNPDEQVMQKYSESLLDVVEIVYMKDAPGLAYGDTIQVTHSAGESNGSVFPFVYDPSILTGHNYRVDFNSVADTGLVWNLTDVTTSTVLLNNQTNFSGDEDYPVVDGFRIIVKDASHLSYHSILYHIIDWSYYYITDFYQFGLATTSRSIDVFGRGTDNRQELEKDYELRFTGEYEDPEDDIVYIKEGTGSMATLYDAQFYELQDHPMNPEPGSNDPFAVRIPFEVWNINDNRQVNVLIYDRYQHLSDRPFYSFNPYSDMFCHILNTPYSETAVDTAGSEMDNLTWSIIVAISDFRTGDEIQIFYENFLTTEDIFVFNASPNMVVNNSDNILPEKFELYQNYPNPFNPSTTISFALPKSELVKLKIYDILGREVRMLINSRMQPGIKKVDWDGRNKHGHPVPSGLYFYRLKAGNFTDVKKMLIIK
jgi:uncharacterized repeat protein (TIGR01451 family)